MNIAVWERILPVTVGQNFTDGKISRGLWVGTGGDITVLTSGGETVEFKNVPDGTFLGFVAIRRVVSVTDAADLVGGY